VVFRSRQPPLTTIDIQFQLQRATSLTGRPIFTTISSWQCAFSKLSRQPYGTVSREPTEQRCTVDEQGRIRLAISLRKPPAQQLNVESISVQDAEQRKSCVQSQKQCQSLATWCWLRSLMTGLIGVLLYRIIRYMGLVLMILYCISRTSVARRGCLSGHEFLCIEDLTLDRSYTVTADHGFRPHIWLTGCLHSRPLSY